MSLWFAVCFHGFRICSGVWQTAGSGFSCVPVEAAAPQNVFALSPTALPLHRSGSELNLALPLPTCPNRHAQRRCRSMPFALSSIRKCYRGGNRNNSPMEPPEPVALNGTQPPFIQKTIKHGEMPIWLHANCMLYTPECFVEYPEPPSTSANKDKDKKDGGAKAPAAGDGAAKPEEVPAAAADAKPEEKGDGAGKGSSVSPKREDGAPAAAAAGAAGKGDKAPADDLAAGGGGGGGAVAGRKPKPVYYGVDEARKRVAIRCTSCGKSGALIGCHVQSCSITTHFACARREGWKFGDPDADGKVFLCVMHRQEGQVRFQRKTPAKKAPRKSGESFCLVCLSVCRPVCLSACLASSASSACLLAFWPVCMFAPRYLSLLRSVTVILVGFATRPAP